MSDITKIVIATISGFIAAFFAEPAKLYFQNRQKIAIFRLALYAEIYNNYRLLSTFLKIYKANSPDEIKIFFEGTTRDSLRTDCYVQLSSHYPDIYYQLEEFIIINILYSYLTSAMDPSVYSANNVAKFHRTISSFVILVEEHVTRNELDQKIMKRASGKEDIKMIVENFQKRHQGR